MPSPRPRAPTIRIVHGPSPAPTNTCSVHAGQWTKSQAFSGRSSPSTSSRHSPESTRKSSSHSSPWYMQLGWPGFSTWMLMPISRNLGSPSNSTADPNSSVCTHSESRALITNQPSPRGRAPFSPCSITASGTMRPPCRRRSVSGGADPACRGQPLLLRPVAGAHQRPGEHRPKAHQLALLAHPCEVVGRHPTVERQVAIGGLQVLADGDDVHAVVSQIAHHHGHVLVGLAHADDDAALGRQGRSVWPQLGPHRLRSVQQVERLSVVALG